MEGKIMEYDKIKQLMDDMGNSKLTAIDIDFPDGTKISMKKEQKQETIVVNQPVDFSHEITKELETPIVANENSKEETKGTIIKSPMVGTFYIKPSPSSEPYIEIGANVNKGDTLCIIEAMKLMNEIEAEFSGKVLEVLVKDGDTVEYGTPLFRINEI
jgi:acetyl-CoA carboxylase biotin carboxyl carrier protein